MLWTNPNTLHPCRSANPINGFDAPASYITALSMEKLAQRGIEVAPWESWRWAPHKLSIKRRGCRLRLEDLAHPCGWHRMLLRRSAIKECRCGWASAATSWGTDATKHGAGSYTWLMPLIFVITSTLNQIYFTLMPNKCIILWFIITKRIIFRRWWFMRIQYTRSF
jgi:hypothetical protein